LHRPRWNLTRAMYSSIPTTAGGPAGNAAAKDDGVNESESQPLCTPKEEEAAAEIQSAARKRLIASSVGLFADAYDIFSIDIVLLILDFLYADTAASSESKSLMVSALLLGIILGQLTFGFVADLVGRKWAFVATAGLTILGAGSSAFACDRPGFALPAQLALCRLVLGLGIGGEYPLSASVTAEAASDPAQRGFMLAVVISMQGWGMLLSSLVAMVALAAGCSLEALWRLLLALGALPSLLAFGLRWQLHESSAYSRASAAGTEGEAPANRTALLRKLWPRLLGTSLSWFLMNMSLYSLGSFKSTVLNELVELGSMPKRREVAVTAGFAALTSCFAIAGFSAALALINRMGRYQMQLLGFAALSVLFLVQAVLTSDNSKLPSWLYVCLLGLVFFFQNLGPNTTTFVIPAEAFPTLVRATCHGVSAAVGKVGAFIGTTTFPGAEATYGMRAVYVACAVTAALGTLVTYVLTPRSCVDMDSIGD